MAIEIEHEALAVLAEKYHVLHGPEAGIFQCKSSILQSMWRDEQGFDMGFMRSKPAGTLLKMPWAEDTLSNYLTRPVQKIVKMEVGQSNRKCYQWPAVYNDLNSYQGLCFNLFGNLKDDLNLATSVFAKLLPECVDRVTAVDFRYATNNMNDNFKAGMTIFDVFITYESTEGYEGFIAIDVNYQQNLSPVASQLVLTADDISAMGFLLDTGNVELKEAPLAGILHKHFVTDNLVFYDHYDEGLFVYLYPRDNQHCTRTVERYRSQLKKQTSFQAWTLDHFHHILTRCSVDDWVAMLYDRYLDFDKVTNALSSI